MARSRFANSVLLFSLLSLPAILFAGAWYDSLQVDNININGNTISSTDSNGNIILSPNGGGGVKLPQQPTGRVMVTDGTNTLVADQDITTAELFLLNGLTTAPVTADSTATLTNKTINVNSNTVTNIADANISSSAAIDLTKLANLTNSRALVSNGTGDVSVATTTATEIGYVNGVTSAIQTQLDAKQARSTLTTKGDIYAATASATVTRLPVGSNTFVLTADSAEATGLKWAAQGTGPSVGLYCTINWGYASNAFWGTNSSTFALPAADTDYPTPTVTTSTIATAAGVTCSAPGTKVAQLVTTSLPAGEYKVVFEAGGSSDTSIRCYGRVTDGTTTGKAQTFGIGTNTQIPINPTLDVVYGSTSSPTFSFHMASNAGGACSILNGYDTGKSESTIYLYRVR